MLLFIIFGIFFFPKINAEDEIIQIYPNKTIHWKRHCEPLSVVQEVCVEAQNAKMKYIIDSPDTIAIGKLVKETKIEGCQHVGGCTLILTLGTVSK